MCTREAYYDFRDMLSPDELAALRNRYRRDEYWDSARYMIPGDPLYWYDPNEEADSWVVWAVYLFGFLLLLASILFSAKLS